MTNLHRLFAIALTLALITPGVAFAASSKPTCSLTVISPRGEVTTRDEIDIFAYDGETLTLEWESKNAKKAVDDERKTVDLSDSITVTAEQNETYGITFSNGSKKAECSVNIRMVEGSFDTSTLSIDDTKPKIGGEADGTKAVRLEIRDANNRKSFTSKEIKVRGGEWEVPVTKTLKAGTYTATLLGDKKFELNTLATTTLTILPKGSAGTRGGSISVSPLALLTGGVATNGTSVPVAYIQVRNTGTATTTISGFTLTENGSIMNTVVAGFATNDDKGGSRATYMTQFKNGSVFVPLSYALKAGELRIFTIKAQLSPNKILYGNKELKINVAGVDTGASVVGMFPIIGTTWILR